MPAGEFTVTIDVNELSSGTLAKNGTLYVKYQGAISAAVIDDNDLRVLDGFADGKNVSAGYVLTLPTDVPVGGDYNESEIGYDVSWVSKTARVSTLFLARADGSAWNLSQLLNPEPIPLAESSQNAARAEAAADEAEAAADLASAISGLTGEDDAVALLAATSSTATGAELRGRFPEVVVIRGAGIDPTGTTNSKTAIQAKIDAAAAAGVRAILPEGRYRISAGQLYWPSNTHIEGNGNATIYFDWADGVTYGRYSGNSDIPGGNSNIKIRNINFEGASDGTPFGAAISPSAGILLRNCTDVEVSGCTFYRITGPVICPQGVIRGKFIGNTIKECGRGGIVVAGVFNQPTHGIVIANNVIYNIGDDAIAVVSNIGSGTAAARPWGVSITGNVIRGRDTAYPDAYGRGILVMGSEDVAITGNTIRDTPSYGIAIVKDNEGVEQWSSRDITVGNNTVRGAGLGGSGGLSATGIFVQNSEYVTVSDNTVTGCLHSGIQVGLTSRWKVTGNDVHENGSALNDAGILLLGTTSAFEVSYGTVADNNVHRNAGSGVRSVYTDRVRIVNNIFTDNGALSDGTNPLGSGIYLDTTGNMSVSGNTCTDTRATGKTQTRGLYSTAQVMALLRLVDNNFVGNTSAGTLFGAEPAICVRRGNVISTTGGSSLNYDQDVSGTHHGSGSGTPQSVLAWNPGSTWRQTNGGTGLVLWVKETGAGSTGWVAK